MIRIALSAVFLACILAANYATTTWEMVPVGFGLQATAGTYFAGATFVLRDTLHDLFGKWYVVGLIVGGAVLSFAVSDPRIALASAAAFLIAELADLLAYIPLRERRGYLPAAVVSNTVGAFVDTVVFLGIAGFPIWQSLPGQMVGKLAMTLPVVAAYLILRQRRAA